MHIHTAADCQKARAPAAGKDLGVRVYGSGIRKPVRSLPARKALHKHWLSLLELVNEPMLTHGGKEPVAFQQCVLFGVLGHLPNLAEILNPKP